jgi:hypothetical protein
METQDYQNREFMIFDTSELDKIDFTQVHETSADTVRKSVNGKRTFVKWGDVIPSSVESLITKEGPYTYKEILNILSGPEWSSNNRLV